MTYAIVCLLTAALSAAGTWLMCRYLLSRLGMRELGIKEIPATVREVPGEGEYVPRCGGLLPSAAVLGVSAVMLTVYALVSGAGSSSGIPRLSGIQSMSVWGGMIMAPLFCAAGFMEDYARVFRKMSRGLAEWQRLGVKAVIAAAFLAALWLAGDRGDGMTALPFAGQIRLGFWYYPLSLLLIVGVVHGAELVQEADGVMPTVGFFSFVPYIIAAGMLARSGAAMADTGIISAAGACGCMVFMAWNFVPARCRCGRAGGAFMGALLCAAAFCSGMPLLLVLTGGVYLAESVTALAGWTCRLLLKKDVFAPLHRMIGRRGKNDIQITVILAGAAAIAAAAAAALMLFGAE